MSDTHEWPGGIAAITLFVEDLDSAKRFYAEVFELPTHYEDDDSTVFRFGDTLVNLLKATEAAGLVGRAQVASRDAGVRFQFTLGVDDVDSKCEELRRRGVELLPLEQDSFFGPYIQLQLVRIYALTGEPDGALDQLEPLLRIPFYLSPGWLRLDPAFDGLRGEPRFGRLVVGKGS